MSELRLLLTAVQYFTRIRVPDWVGHAQERLTGAIRYFPAVGVLVGACAAAVLWLTAQIFPAPLPAILSTVITVMLTGAIHEDGLADTFDGLGGGATRERALEIMKDPRLGTYGAIALMLTLSLKVAALSNMPIWIAMTVLLSAHAYSRFCAVIVMFSARYVGNADRSRAAPLIGRMSAVDVFIAALFGIVPLMLVGALAIVASLAALMLLALLLSWFVNRLGGYTGDTLGAAQQVTEVGFYLTIAATWKWLLVNSL
jgi:adenosylcobinamide-GDP ribazoletransferase